MNAGTVEEWRPIPSFPGYDASNLGRVRSWLPYHGLALPRLKKVPTVVREGKYPVLTLSVNGRQAYRSVHRLVAEAFLGPLPQGLETRHLDGNRLNCALSNLAYGTRSENNLDAVGHGTHPFAARTHCPRGHLYDDANTFRDRRGRRRCRACARARARVWSARRKAAS